MRLLYFFMFSIVCSNVVYSSDVETKDRDELIESLEENSIRLEEQNAILKSSVSDIRDSYYWALGFAATVLILFLGSNMYFLRNRYNADKAALQNHIDNEIASFKTESDEKLLSSFAERDKQVSEEIPKKVSAATSSLISKISGSERDIKRLEINVLELKLKNTKNSGVKVNELTQCFHLAVKCRELGTGSYLDWDISNYLSEVSNLLDEGVKFEGEQIPEVTKFLMELPPQFEDIVAKVRARLSA